MKKLLIVPMVLALIIFSLYPEDIDGMDTSTKGNVTKEIQLEEEILKIYNNSKNEINNTLETNETTQVKVLDKNFSVEIKGELNTTKETVITLKAVVKNAQKLEACNYWWYEAKELIDMGSTLEKAFTKGEHNITLVVRDVNGTETNSTAMVRAYNYKSIRTLHYDAYYGTLRYTERTVTNHKGQYVLYDSGIYSKELMTYDDKGMLVERVREYYNHPEENRKIEFTYDDKGNRLVSQTFNSEGISINYMLSIYDDNSSLIDIKFGTSAEDIENNEVPEYEYEEVIYDASTYIEVKIPEDIVKLNDNGQVIYEERYYGEDDKVISTMTYNEDNKLIRLERIRNSSYDKGRSIIDYDAKGNEIKKEHKYQMDGQSLCHYSSKSTFTDSGQIKSRVSTLLGGECPYVDEVKRLYSYDEEDNVIAVKAITNGEELSDAHSTVEVIKEYINELDI